MNGFRMHALTISATLLAAAAVPLGAAAAELRVMIPNLEPEGRIVVSLYNNPGSWQAQGKPFLSAVAPVVDGMAVVNFAAPPGAYAVAAFQDRDDDGKLKTLAFGYPTEPSGYSGVKRPLFGRPPWHKSEFNVTSEDRITVFVRLK